MGLSLYSYSTNALQRAEARGTYNFFDNLELILIKVLK
jgi:hypothetical protein